MVLTAQAIAYEQLLLRLGGRLVVVAGLEAQLVDLPQMLARLAVELVAFANRVQQLRDADGTHKN